MKHHPIVAAVSLASFTVVIAGVALAMPMNRLNNLPPEENYGAVTYRTGGIGESEAKAMQQAESQYPLSLEFVEHARPRDEFLANVDVTIRDPAGTTTLRTVADGPFLLADLPDGRYTVIASEDGLQKVRHVTIASGKTEHVVIEWQ